jgi:tetratricopeptide (TPR) repeat protein
LAVVGLLLAATARAEEKAPWERRLEGEDARKASQLEKQIQELIAAQKVPETFPLVEELLALRRRIQGPAHWQTVNLRIAVEQSKQLLTLPADQITRLTEANKHLAEAGRLRGKGNRTEADSLYRKALTIFREVVGEQDTRTAKVLHELAGNLLEQGQSPGAEKAVRQALDVRRKVLGEQHPDTISSLLLLAVGIDRQARGVEAELVFREALANCRLVVGEEHENTATILSDLGLNLGWQGKYAEAESLLRRAVAIYRAARGERDPHTLTVMNNLALNLNGQGKYAEGEILVRQVLDVESASPGPRHPATPFAFLALAESLHGQRRYTEAEPLLREVVATRRKDPGNRHPDTALALNNLAINLHAQGKYAEAERLYEEALAILRVSPGERHPYTALTLSNLAGNRAQQGKYAEAEPLFRQALEVRRRALGARHPGTALSLNNLAAVLHAQGKYAEAEPLYGAATALVDAARLRVAPGGFDRAPFAGERPSFAGLVACLARRGQAAEAWRQAEAGYARGLLDDLTEAERSSAGDGERQRARARATRLAQLDRLLMPLLMARDLPDGQKAQLEQLSGERDTLQAEDVREAAERSRREVFALERVQEQLPADAALVFWLDFRSFATAGEHWGCVVRRRGPAAWYLLPGSGGKGAWTGADDRLPGRLLDSLHTGDADWLGLARRLARQRLDPLAPSLGATGDLPAVRRLVVVARGPMVGVPVEALSDSYTVGYAPSATVYARLRERHRPLREPSLLALGDPVFRAPAAVAPPPDHGLLVTLVVPGGSMAGVGLRRGDVLLRYGEKEMQTAADLGKPAATEPVAIQVWRDGKTFEWRLAPGPLGILVYPIPAPEGVLQYRDLDAWTAGDARPLPATRYEVGALRTLVPTATVLLGSEASEQRLDELAAAGRLKDFRLLHLATHGRVHPSAADQSALLLSRDRLPDPAERARQGKKVYDGRLKVAAIAAGWTLDADLVTLSACQTALGPSGGGEGLLGFSQVLFRKGARSLLLSLWKVDDTATALLMVRFYENLLGKREGQEAPVPKAEALREAKCWLRQLSRGERDRLAGLLARETLRATEVPGKPLVRRQVEPGDAPYGHPRFWAAFILMGDPD